MVYSVCENEVVNSQSSDCTISEINVRIGPRPGDTDDSSAQGIQDVISRGGINLFKM